MDVIRIQSASVSDFEDLAISRGGGSCGSASPTARSRCGSVPTSTSRHATCSSCRPTTWWHQQITGRIFPNHPAGTLAKARPAHDIRSMALPPVSWTSCARASRLVQLVGRKVAWNRASRTRPRATTGRRARSTRKSPRAFTSTTRKGFYYCFGCHAKGDAIAFVRETENARLRRGGGASSPREAGMAARARPGATPSGPPTGPRGSSR